MRLATLGLMTAMLSACSATQFSSLGLGGKSAQRLEKNRVENLNQLSAQRTNILNIHFDNLDHANLYRGEIWSQKCDVQSMIFPAPPRPPECDSKPEALVSVGGRGRVWGEVERADGSVVALFEGLPLEITFDDSLEGDKGCLSKAQEALRRRRGFRIVGTASLIGIDKPIYSSGPGEAPSGGVVENLFDQGLAVGEGRTQAQAFTTLPIGLGLVLSSIESCEVGDVFIDDPVIDPPPLCEVIKTQTANKSLPVVECVQPLPIEQIK